MSDVDNEELAKLLQAGVPYVDVRTPEEYRAGHIPGSRNVPVMLRGDGGQLVPNPTFVPSMLARYLPEAPVAVGCASGVRSKQARALLGRAGYTLIYHLAGGMNGGRDAFGAKIPGWAEAGMPLVAGDE